MGRFSQASLPQVAPNASGVARAVSLPWCAVTPPARHTSTLISASLLGEAAQNSLFGFFLRDETGRILAANAAMSELTGFDHAELIGNLTPGFNVDPAEGRARLVELNAGPAAGRTAITRRDGSRLDLQFLGGPTTVAGTRYVFVCVWSVNLA